MAERLAQLQPSAGTIGTIGVSAAPAAQNMPPTFLVPPPATAAVAIDQPGAAAVAIARLSQPPAGFRSLKLPMREGFPVFGLDPLLRGNEAIFFRLIALKVSPSLIEGDDGAEDARQFASDFLDRPNKYLGQFGNWSGDNEFQRDASRRAFLNDYGKTLQQIGPQLPFEFLYAAPLTIGAYNAKLGGFPLIGAPDLRSLPLGSLQPSPDFKWPELFLPVDEAGAQRLLGRLQAARAAGPGNPRAVRLAAVLEATRLDPGSLELQLGLRRLTLYDADVRESLYEFPVATVAHRPARDIVSKLLAPPPGVMPIRLPVLDGRPILDRDEASGRFLTLAALGSMPALLSERQGVDQRLISASEASLVRHFLTPVVQRQLLDNPNFTSSNWLGGDEFARNRARQNFEQNYLPELKEIAPAAPFEFAYSTIVQLPEYDAKRGGFALGKSRALNELTDNSSILVPMGLKWSLQFEPPDLFWSLDAPSAQRLLHQLERAAARQQAIGRSANERLVQVVLIVEAFRIDPATGRTTLRLKAVHLYTPDLNTRLYTYPATAAEAEPYITAVMPGKLDVPNPAPLDPILLDLKFIDALGDKTPDTVYAALWQLVEARDQAFYARPDRWAGLAPNDARRPFFPRGSTDRTQPAMAAFRNWAKTYIASLPAMAVAASNGISYGTDLVQPLDAGDLSQSGGYGGFLGENHLQADQLVSPARSLFAGGSNVQILFVMPNRWSLYTLKIPKDALERHPGAGPASISTFKLGAARVIRSDAGQTVLAIDLTPLSTRSSIGNDTLASRTYDDIPRLDGQAFTADSPQASPAANGAPLALNSTLLDLLAAKAIGERLSPQALAYLVERRWLSENKGITPGGRFFMLGKRQPTPKEAAAMASGFIDWARQHGPAFPVRVTISARVDISNGQKTAPWRVIECLGINLRDATWFGRLRQWSRSEAADEARHKEMAATGSWAWSQLQEEKLAALEAVSSAVEAFYIGGGPSGPCGLAAPSLSFPDPAFFTIRIPHALPTPSVLALAGKQQLDLTATLDITSTALSPRPPSLADVLPPVLAKVIPQFPGETPTGEFVSFDATFLEAHYRDPSGREVARLGRDQGEKSRRSGDKVPATTGGNARRGRYARRPVWFRPGRGPARDEL